MRYLFHLPHFDDERQTQQVRLLWLVLGIVALSFTLESVIELFILPGNALRWLFFIGVVDITSLVLLAISRRGYVSQASMALVGVLWALVTGLAITEGGIRAPTVDIAYLVIILIAGLLLNEKAGIITGVISALTLLGLAVAGTQGLLPPSVVHRSLIATWEADIFYLAIVIGLQYLAIHAIRNALEQAHRELVERRRVEADLHKAKDYAEKLIQTANAIALQLDPHGCVVVSNQAAEEITGYSHEELANRNWFETIAPRDRFPEAWADFQDLMDGNPTHSFEGPILTRDGAERLISWHASDLREQGKIVGAIMFGIDITEREQMAKERLQTQLRLELHGLLADQLEKERLKIARDLHDGPVQGILGATFTLQYMIEDTKDAAFRKGLQDVQEALHEQVSSLRGFAGELRPPTLMTFGLVKAVYEHLRGIQEKHPEIAVDVEAQPEDLPLPEETRMTLYRIYQEAMNNILRHAQASQVHIRLTEEDGHVRMEIRDNGVGFTPPEEWMDLARHGHLGLVGMRERVEAIGGEFEMNSREGEGTTVIVTMPV